MFTNAEDPISAREHSRIGRVSFRSNVTAASAAVAPLLRVCVYALYRFIEYVVRSLHCVVVHIYTTRIH